MYKLASALKILLFLSLAGSAWGAIDAYEFESEEQQDRFRQLIAELRCPKCLNANIAGSDAPIAADLRAEVHDQILAGKSDAEIMAFMKERYGDFISYKPPLNAGTFMLWFGPAILLLLGIFIVRRMVKAQRAAGTDTELSPEEQQKLRKILSSKSE